MSLTAKDEDSSSGSFANKSESPTDSESWISPNPPILGDYVTSIEKLSDDDSYSDKETGNLEDTGPDQDERIESGETVIRCSETWQPKLYKTKTNVEHSFPDEWFTDNIENEEELSLHEDPHDINRITREDCDLISRKWRYIRHDLATFSALVLQELNKPPKKPVEKLYLRKVKTKTPDYERGSLAKIKNFYIYLDKILIHLDKPKTVFSIMYEMAGPHGKVIWKPLNKRDIQEFKTGMLRVIAIHYSFNNSPEVFKAFNKVLTIVLALIEDLTHWDDFGGR